VTKIADRNEFMEELLILDHSFREFCLIVLVFVDSSPMVKQISWQWEHVAQGTHLMADRKQRKIQEGTRNKIALRTCPLGTYFL
jgi:hypothetical protein